MRSTTICRPVACALLASVFLFGFAAALLLVFVPGTAHASIVLDLDAVSLGRVETYDTRPPEGIFDYDTYTISGHQYGANSGSVHIDLETISADAAGGWTISDPEIYAETYVRNETGPEGWTAASARMDIYFTLDQTIDALLDFERTNPDVTIGAGLRLGNDEIWTSNVTDIRVPLTLDPGRYRFSWYAEAINQQTHSDLTTGRITFQDGTPPVVEDTLIDNVLAGDLNPANNPVIHTFTATDNQPVSELVWSNLSFDSYIPAFGGTGVGPLHPATFDAGTQLFSWNSIGSPRGIYKWNVTATDRSGYGWSDIGTLTVNVVGPVPGDYNLNGTVDAADYTIWRDQGVGNFVEPCSGADENCNGVIDNQDYATWKNHFGESVPSGAGSSQAAGSVPEPSTALMVVLMSCGLALVRRRF